ncbi:MAG TPA: hypothetical protein VFH55_04745 [Nitrospiria bacterium]|nr:hypothetical protein [Nitrospiria bacterium]
MPFIYPNHNNLSPIPTQYPPRRPDESLLSHLDWIRQYETQLKAAREIRRRLILGHLAT